ncbi:MULTISPECIES: DUF3667 domain-containing protein [Chryseobacterium]|uniref:DUF3667 domain-containing protein n=1 Tax=Chryseobacterium TaxID=59732 RepID=UPI000C250870|nr:MULTISPECIES: DUF3667 domain-containing protein [Chryseobacterium]MPS64347.1 DUF3667 domain-containing protein [Chryseobacterium sp.]PZU20770.1 MAG: DUF3667 domain-containing protein [Chryseobacterium sp.]
MSKKSCLNCGHSISGEFCAHCGQKADTARITIYSLIKNDILGSIWHVETKFLHTLKNILFRPGTTAMDYISGKRIRYNNFISLLLILFGFNVLTYHFYRKFAPPEELTDDVLDMMNFISKYSKTILFVIIPMLAFNAYFLFKRIKLNVAEHFIIGTVSLLGILILFLLSDIVSLIGLWKPVEKIFNIIDKILFGLSILFPAITYWTAFKNSYSKPGLLWRVSVLYVLMVLEGTVISLILYEIF